MLQQLATPAEIYNNPANLFVAQFIGSPPMNVVKGALEGKNFMTTAPAIATPVGGRIAKAVLGVRPEDCSVVAPAKGAIKGEIYATELIGDHTLVTVEGGQRHAHRQGGQGFHRQARRKGRRGVQHRPPVCVR